ncbi:MAG TPA: gephyrin-like molybdotransferase Glp [Acidimicrobiales bacterium]|nr:gephyrin-like molybdotransferase Glp [Acidimicrobiales bacterium]
MISLDDAVARIRAAIEPLHPRAVPLDDALGRVLSVAVTSDVAVPPFANTAMDGFAVRAADTSAAPVELRIVGDLPAGRDPAGLRVGTGEAVRIMTGAPMPEGADAVVMVERTAVVDPGTVRIEVAVSPGNHVRGVGEDVAPGDEVFPPFTVLRAGHLGLLATLGLRNLPVYPRARVGVLSTGDELVEGPAALRPGQIRDANRHSLLALVREAGCEAVDLGIVGDEVGDVRAAIAEALDSCDALLTSGGVSMGDWDPVKVVLRELAGETPDASNMHVAIRPAKPLSFVVARGKPVFGLPGNPASSMVSFELFARPALLAMMGHRRVDRPRLLAVADEAFDRRPDGKLHLVRVTLRFRAEDARYHCRSSGGQGSHLLRSMAGADGFALLPDGDGCGAGELIEVLDLR